MQRYAFFQSQGRHMQQFNYKTKKVKLKTEVRELIN